MVLSRRQPARPGDDEQPSVPAFGAYGTDYGYQRTLKDADARREPRWWILHPLPIPVDVWRMGHLCGVVGTPRPVGRS